MKVCSKLHLSYFGEPAVKVLEDEIYEVAVFQNYISIRRKDGKDGISWDELQRIKDMCGYAEQDAVEVYPRAVDVYNTGNVRHLWVATELLPKVWRQMEGLR